MIASPANVLAADEAHLWYAWTERCCTPARLAYYRSLLSEDEAERLERLRFDYLKHEFLLTRALCRLSLSSYTNVPPDAWRFQANAFGRPHVATPETSSPLRFNLANARSLVACIITREVDAGVDVEETHRHADIVDLADQYFSNSELQALQSLPKSLQHQRFFALWTLKESYIKARGMGLSIPLDQFSFCLDQAGPIHILFNPSLADTATDWQFELLAPSDRHLMAVSVRRGSGSDMKIKACEIVPGAKVT